MHTKKDMHVCLVLGKLEGVQSAGGNTRDVIQVWKQPPMAMDSKRGRHTH